MKHYHIDINELRDLWEAGWLVEDLADKYRVSKAFIYWLRKKYNISDRSRSQSTEPGPPSQEDAIASGDSLRLSPWVEARVKAMREEKLAKMRDEPWTTTKARLWREGVETEN